MNRDMPRTDRPGILQGTCRQNRTLIQEAEWGWRGGLACVLFVGEFWKAPAGARGNVAGGGIDKITMN